MKRTGWLASLLLIFTALSIPVQGTADTGTNWTTRGKTADRSQTTLEALGPLTAVPAWSQPPQVGPSGSQPVFVNDRIYHLAGEALWEITPQGVAEPLAGPYNRLRDQPDPRPSTSGVTYVDGAHGGAIYFGTGDNRLCVLRLRPSYERCIRLTEPSKAEEPIVTVPLVYQVSVGGRPSDLVVMGDKRGRVWVVQDLLTAATDSAVRYYNREVGGWVLASPVAVGDAGDLTFVWGNDRGSEGTISAYRIIPAVGDQALTLVHAWLEQDGRTPYRVRTWAGVADGFARDGDLVYASDTAGNFYEVNAARKRSRELLYSTQAGPMFANASPAVDESHVYFVIRNVGTATPSSTHPGRLVALDKASFKVAWTADLPAPANTNPLVWAAGPQVVLVGDTKGTIHAFDRLTGKPTPFAINLSGPGPDGRYQCRPTASLNVGSTDLADDRRLYQNLTGITDPILASGTTDQGLLLFGLSGKQGADYVGWLHAYAAGGAYNVSWAQTALPEAQLPVGEAHTITGQLTWAPWGLAPGTGAREFTVQAFLAPEGGGPGRKIHEGTVTLQPDQPAGYTINLTPLETDPEKAKIEVYVNPQLLLVDPGEMGQRYRITAGYTADPVTGAATKDGLLPGQCAGAESELLQTGSGSATADNLLEQPVTIAKAVDLAVFSLTMARNVACGENLAVSYTLRNASPRTVPGVRHTVRVLAGGSWRVLRSITADLAPGDTALSISVPGTPCGEPLRVEVAVNPDRTIAETTYSNNYRSDMPVVRFPEQQWNFSGGGTNVIIVPADCLPNPDPTSSQPCTNYPNLIIP